MKSALVPSFQPPKATSISKMSEYDRIGLVIKMNAQNNMPSNDNDLLSRFLPTNTTTSMNPIEYIGDENISNHNLDLFDGQLSYNNPVFDKPHTPKSPPISSGTGKQIPKANSVDSNDHLSRRESFQNTSSVQQDSRFSNPQSNFASTKITSLENNQSTDIRGNVNLATTHTTNLTKNSSQLSDLFNTDTAKKNSQNRPNTQSSKSSKGSTTAGTKSMDSIHRIDMNNMKTKSPSFNSPTTVSVDELSSSTHHYYALHDFQGMNTFSRNIGASYQGYHLIQQKIQNKSTKYAISILFMDLTTNHMTSTVKYCTPSQTCTRWFCSCDRTVRLNVAYQDILGILIVFEDESNIVYFLPLATCDNDMTNYIPNTVTNDANASNTMNNSYNMSKLLIESLTSHQSSSSMKMTIPLKCTVSLIDRWNLFFELWYRPCYYSINLQSQAGYSSGSYRGNSSQLGSTPVTAESMETSMNPCIVYHAHIIHLIMSTYEQRLRQCSPETLSVLFTSSTVPSSSSRIPSSQLSNMSSTSYTAINSTPSAYDNILKSVYEGKYRCQPDQISKFISTQSNTQFGSYTTSSAQAFTSPFLSTTPTVTTSNVSSAISTPYPIFDPRIAAYMCRSDMTEESLEIQTLCQLFGAPIVSFEKSSFCPMDSSTLGKVTRVVGTVFMELRSLLRIHTMISTQIDKLHMYPVYHRIEMPLVQLLSHMEVNGINIDIDQLNSISKTIKLKIVEIEKDVEVINNYEVINLASPEQVATLLYHKLHLPTPANYNPHSNMSSSGNSSSGNSGNRGLSPPPVKKQKHASTSEEDLLKIRHLHPVVDHILHFRALNKFLCTYIDGIKPYLITFQPQPLFHVRMIQVSTSADGEGHVPTPYELIQYTPQQFISHKVNTHSTHHPTESSLYTNRIRNQSALLTRIHACFNQTIVRTGRLSCCRPNLQSIPNTITVKEVDMNIRNLFTASPGCILIAADYSQIEVRVLAHIANDPALLSLFRAEGDIYNNMASMIFKKPVESISSAERTKAKTICLGSIYGMGPQLCAQKLNIDIPTATSITHSFFEKFKHIQQWIHQIKRNAHIQGYVSTLCGRRRYIDEIHSKDHTIRATGERQAVNSIIQGSASDIIKLAMLLIHEKLSVFPMSHHRSTLQTNPPDIINIDNEYDTYNTTTNNSTSHSSDCSSLDLSDTSFTSYLSRVKLLMQIHDELIYEIPLPYPPPPTSLTSTTTNTTATTFTVASTSASSYENHPINRHFIVYFIQLMKRSMEDDICQLLQLKVPLISNIKIGYSWGSMTRITV